jgi:hypothetical protein
LERKVAQGFEVLEIAKGTWVEAIFAKKKEPLAKIRMNEDKYDEDGNLRKSSNRNALDDDEDLPEEIDREIDDDNDNSPDDDQMDEMYYSSITEGAKNREDQDDDEYAGLTIDEADE